MEWDKDNYTFHIKLILRISNEESPIHVIPQIFVFLTHSLYIFEDLCFNQNLISYLLEQFLRGHFLKC